MSGGEVVCSGWLRKSPPEKKLKRYVSRARPPFPFPGGSRAGCCFPLVPILFPWALSPAGWGPRLDTHARASSWPGTFLQIPDIGP